MLAVEDETVIEVSMMMVGMMVRGRVEAYGERVVAEVHFTEGGEEPGQRGAGGAQLGEPVACDEEFVEPRAAAEGAEVLDGVEVEVESAAVGEAVAEAGWERGQPA